MNQNRPTRNFIIAAAVIANVAGMAAFFYADPINILIGLCAFFPPAGVILLFYKKDIVFFEEKKDPRLSIAYTFYIPAVALAWRAWSDYVLLHPLQSLLPVAILAAVFTAILVAATRRSSPWYYYAVLMPFILAYAYGAVIQANCLLDASDPASYSAVVEKKWSHRAYKGGTSYYLGLASWGPPGSPRTLTVKFDRYNETPQNQPIVIEIKKGELAMPWFSAR